jgi:hypothetical protein
VDTSTIVRTIHRTYLVDLAGEPTEMTSESAPYWSCQEHGMSFGTWDSVMLHLLANHGEGAPTGNGQLDSVSSVEAVSMQLEDPSDG